MQKQVRIVDGWELSIRTKHVLGGRKYYVIGTKCGTMYWFHATQSYINAIYYLHWVDPETTFHMRWI